LIHSFWGGEMLRGSTKSPLIQIMRNHFKLKA
jgi:hypothetical protein